MVGDLTGDTSSKRSLPLTKVALWLVFLVLQLLISSGERDPDGKYLYFGDKDTFPVQDYHVAQESDSDLARHPAFIYSPLSRPRVIEFYAPWCPHCQHAVPHYVHFAQQITTVAKENGQVVEVHAISCQVHRNLCHDFGVHAFPRVFLFKAGESNYTKAVPYYLLHPFEVLNDLGVQVDNLKLTDELPALDLSKNKKKTADISEISRLHKRTKQDVFDDAHLSLVFALKNGVYTSNGPIKANTTSHTALKHWLDLLKVALPPTWSVQKLVRALLDDFDNITLSEDNLVQVVDRYPPPKSKWSLSCTHGEPAMGYTCGLWELFHIITVGVVEWNLMIATDDNYELVLSTEDAALTIRHFIANFFGCEVCRLNFINGFDSCAHNRCMRLKPDSRTLEEWSQLPVWLFETHNSVNVRLLNEKFERENLGRPTHQDEINKQWPLHEDCPGCFDEGEGWNDLTIYKYLRIEYWPEDFVTTEYREELFGVVKADGDDEVAVLPSSTFLGLTLVLIVSMSAGWYARKVVKLRRSGYHKKNDSVLPYSNGVYHKDLSLV